MSVLDLHMGMNMFLEEMTASFPPHDYTLLESENDPQSVSPDPASNSSSAAFSRHTRRLFNIHQEF